ncbi:hypothetical protein AB0G85_24475 [Streptomyces sioyaensis]|uniref:hypothetical protein n=1 Tax=Streptomyces sioyaensis TaxID=67364 RepID=UPI0033DA5E06
MADKLLTAMKDEAALLADLQEGTPAHQQLMGHLEWMTGKYVSERALQTQLKIEHGPVIGSLILGSLAGTGGVWATVAGGWSLLWLLLLSPVFLVCVYGFFYEVTGGESRQRLLRQLQPPE